MSLQRVTILRFLYRWHHRIGISAALLILLLASTGIALNHSDSLSLDQTHMQSDLLLDWYGIQAPDNITAYSGGSHWVSQLGRRVYFDEHELSSDNGRLLGAVALNDMQVVALENELILLTANGEIIERLHSFEGMPVGNNKGIKNDAQHGIQKIGTYNGAVVLQTAKGIYRSDQAILNWNQHDDTTSTRWAQSTSLPIKQYQAIAAKYRGKGLTLERVLLDLHSGRIFGQWGVWLMDAAAMMLIMLSLSGSWVWWRRRAR